MVKIIEFNKISPQNRKENFFWCFFQNKEARRLQQSHDPNYLKDSPKSPAKHFEDLPPVQAIDLGVPLHIPGLASADQVFIKKISK